MKIMRRTSHFTSDSIPSITSSASAASTSASSAAASTTSGSSGGRTVNVSVVGIAEEDDGSNGNSVYGSRKPYGSLEQSGSIKPSVSTSGGFANDHDNDDDETGSFGSRGSRGRKSKQLTPQQQQQQLQKQQQQTRRGWVALREHSAVVATRHSVGAHMMDLFYNNCEGNNGVRAGDGGESEADFDDANVDDDDEDRNNGNDTQYHGDDNEVYDDDDDDDTNDDTNDDDNDAADSVVVDGNNNNGGGGDKATVKNADESVGREKREKTPKFSPLRRSNSTGSSHLSMKKKKKNRNRRRGATRTSKSRDINLYLFPRQAIIHHPLMASLNRDLERHACFVNVRRERKRIDVVEPIYAIQQEHEESGVNFNEDVSKWAVLHGPNIVTRSAALLLYDSIESYDYGLLRLNRVDEVVCTMGGRQLVIVMMGETGFEERLILTGGESVDLSRWKSLLEMIKPDHNSNLVETAKSMDSIVVAVDQHRSGIMYSLSTASLAKNSAGLLIHLLARHVFPLFILLFLTGLSYAFYLL